MNINGGGSRDQENSRNSQSQYNASDSISKTSTINAVANNNNFKEFNQNYKIREFEWFEVETKIRKFVNELLQPTIKKISIDKKTLEEVNEKIERNNDQVKCLHDIIHYNDNGVKVIDDIYFKIAATNSNVDILNNKHKQETERIDQFQKHILEEYQHVKDEMKQVQKAKDKFSEDKDSLIQYFETFKKNTQEIITSLNKEITTNYQWTKNEFSKIWENINKADHDLSQNTSEISLHNDKIKEAFEKITSINIKNSSYDHNIEQANKAIETMQANINIAKKFTNKVEDLQNKFKMVENYIEKYSCLYVQGQISETLFSVLDKSAKKKLVQFEDKTFASMNQTILNDDGIPNLNQKIEESISYLEKIIKRNAKYLQQKNSSLDEAYQFPPNETPFTISDKKESLPFGFGESFRRKSDGGDSIDEDNIGQQQRSSSPFQNNNFQQNQGGQIIDNYSNNNNNKTSNSINNTLQQNKFLTGKSSSNNNTIQQQEKLHTQPQQSKRSSMNSLTSNQKYEVNQRQFGQLKLMINVEVQQMKEVIENKTLNLQKGLLENEEIFQLNISKIQDEMEKGISILRQQNNNILLETGGLDKKITSIWNELEKIVNTFNILSETVHKMIHFSTLNNSLVLQDELDKQGIALYGFRNTFNDDPKATKPMRTTGAIGGSQIGSSQQVNTMKNKSVAYPNLTLDQNCISCTGQTAQINQAFKMACLAYNPSTVNIDGRNYKREEVLEVATRLLQAARQQYGLKQNVTEFQELSQMESGSQRNILDVSLSRTDQQNAQEDVSQQQKQSNQVDTANSVLDNVQTGITQNSHSSFTHNGRFYINTQQSQLSNNNDQFRSNYANSSFNQSGNNNSQLNRTTQNILPHLEGLKPRSRAMSKKSQSSNQPRVNSSQRREHTHH